MPKNVVILGSTGSIGESALKVARDIPDRMRVIGLGANRSAEKLARQLAEHGVQQGCLADPTLLGRQYDGQRRQPRRKAEFHG